jgi:hypothetical protein
MSIEFGIDSISYHTELRRGLLHTDLVRKVASTGASWLLIDEEYAEHLSDHERRRVKSAADDAGLRLLYSGRSVGGATSDLRAGLERLAHKWIDIAEVFDSPFVRVHSSWYGTDLIGDDAAVAAEDAYIVDACQILAGVASSRGTSVAIENHSNLTSQRWHDIVAPLYGAGMAMFLDLANGPGMFERPSHAVQVLGPISIGGHVKNLTVTSRENPDDSYYRTGFEFAWTLPSHGVLPVARLLHELEEIVKERDFPLLIEALFPVESRHDLDTIYRNELSHLREIA